MLQPIRATLLAAALACGVATPSAASLLLNHTVRVELLYPMDTVFKGPFDYNVGTDGPQVINTNFLVTLTDTTVTISSDNVSVSAGGFYGIHVFDFYDTVAPITGASVGSVTNFVNFFPSRISFDSNGVFVDLAASQLIDGSLTIQLTGGDPPGRGGVPEPASWSLMIAGFGLAGGALRRRRFLAAIG